MDKNYFASVEFGSLSIKLVVASYFNGKLNIVGKANVPSFGFKNGMIFDEGLLSKSLNAALEEISSKYKINVDEIIIVLPCNNHNIYTVKHSNRVLTERQIISEVQIDAIRNKIKDFKVANDEIYVEEVPLYYVLDGDRILRTPPVGISSSMLTIHCNINALPIDVVKPLNEFISSRGISILGAELSTNCSTYITSDAVCLENQCIQINIGQDVTTVGAYNKSVLVKMKQIQFGTDTLISYLAQTLKISKEWAKALFSSYFVANPDFASDFVFDKENNLSEKRICGIVSNKLNEDCYSLITNTINELIADTNFDKNCVLILTGELNDYEFFIDELSSFSGLRFNEGSINVVGLESQAYINCYGAIVNYINKNRAYIKERFSDKPDVELKDDGTVSIKNTQSSNKATSKFRDIFDD